MKRMYVDVLYTDGKQEHYPVTPKMELEFEMHFKHPVVPSTFNGAGGTRLGYQLAWIAAKSAYQKRGDVIPGALDAWIEGIDAIEVDREDVGPLTETGPESSADLPSSQE